MIVAEDIYKAYGMDRDSFIAFMKSRSQDTAIHALGIDFVELSADRVVMSMAVGPSTHQPAGILHGGASVLLAETAASIASELNIAEKNKYAAVGLEINANHLRSKRDGMVTATATPIHIGRRTMVWDIRITDENDQLICISRCTVAIVEKR